MSFVNKAPAFGIKMLPFSGYEIDPWVGSLNVGCGVAQQFFDMWRDTACQIEECSSSFYQIGQS